MPTYLEALTIRLTTGIAELPEAARKRHSEYFLEKQRADGGFAGREGESDIYYTGFALRSMAILGDLYGPAAERAAGFFREKLLGQETIVDFLSLIYGAALLDVSAGIDIFDKAPDQWRVSVADFLESLRREDGGYAKGAQGNASSTYHTFLVLLCLELIGVQPPEPEGIVRFLLSQRADEGGFLEIRASKRAGTNPTAAAISSLRMLDALDEDICQETVDFLCEMQNDEGGFRANTRIPIADLLSTFTGTLTLTDLGAREEIDLKAALRYVQSMEVAEGGFHGAVWDQDRDVEYSFYGLGGLALLSDQK